ncbi:IS200/IS605 family transposase [Salibacter halophilus]|uniref:IS200/IS605 family transposase n=1 Tax=Salibacter halophilus TaxID=1803916 RepID=A0A6N6M5J0_9FLAO|nr:IS200/IS605 family transposase [Salibacter halophilus]KAB1063220.1 IS200/IS605 family transposase [Salibacter halophilus]
MPQSFNKIWIHVIWATKYREPIIELDIEQKVHQFMSDQLREHGCPVRIINGMPDHVHCLFLQNPKKSISEIIKQVKGSTSFYVNQNELITGKFSWQKGYGAFSVSESDVERVFQYIKNQKRHHQRKSFQEEFEGFSKLHGIT